MPFVTINVLEGKGKDYIKKVSDSINEAVIETMAFPDDDRYQVVNQLSEDCMQYQGRQEERIMMHLVMRSGRPNKAKQAFYKKVVEYLHERVGIKPKMFLLLSLKITMLIFHSKMVLLSLLFSEDII
jgi:5-carboxymethyl-2-hydroxymuconate isomerase